jgi:acyl-CoA thioesterase-1
MISTRLAISVTYGLARTACNPVVLFLVLFSVFLAIPAPIDARPRIIAFGDSLTAGYGLEQGEGLVPQLQRWLDAHGAAGFEVVNRGVSGDTTAGGRARFEWALGGGAMAVVLELGANDMLRGIDPSETRANLDAILAGLAARDLPVLLVGMRSTANFGPDYKRAFDAIYPDLAEQYGTLFDPYFFEGMIGEPEFFQEDGLHPSAAGIARIVERLGPLVLELIGRIEQ